jgi:hypothetical protein
MVAMRASEITGVVFLWSCTACRDSQGMSGEEYAPGRWHLGPMHTEHVPEYAARGWEVTTYADGPPDVVCPHYADLCAADESHPGD